MGGGLLFVSQAMLESWAEQGKIDFVGNVMTLLMGDGKGRSYALDPAVRFMKVIGGEADPNALLAKVKTEAQLRELGAEQAGDSVILGDVGYEVQPGFLAEVSALQAAAAAQRNPEVRAEGAQAPVRPPLALGVAASPAAAATPPPPPVSTQASARPGSSPMSMPKELEARRKEAEALARFLLDNLS